MPHPLTGPVVGFASRLRHPTLFRITVVLMLVSWLWPFDPLPFIDEIATALAVMVLANWRNPAAPAAGADGAADAGGSAGRGSVIEGESRRE